MTTESCMCNLQWNETKKIVEISGTKGEKLQVRRVLLHMISPIFFLKIHVDCFDRYVFLSKIKGDF